MNPTFNHFNLNIVEPAFNHPLTDLIIELDRLRNKQLGGSTHPNIFFQLKQIFHLMESLGSARIEGNRTTIAEYIETKLENKPSKLPSIREIQNGEKAMAFIDDNIKDISISRAFISELHKIVVDGLLPPPEGEGDITPGQFRVGSIRIAQSSHLPPENGVLVDQYMEELFTFCNQSFPPKYDLLKIAIAHHRFVWIHPFNNGNGRTVRLFTYAQLVKQGFHVDLGRILNPTAVFCSNRDAYNNFLADADKGTDEGILAWCHYVLQGLKQEIEKVDRLADYQYLKTKILAPALDYSLERKHITELEGKILKRAIEKQVIQASDLKELFPGKHAVEISRAIRRMIGNKLLHPERANTRKYLLRFDNNYLLRGIIRSLDQEGFLPLKGESS
jgi:Fic family protein